MKNKLTVFLLAAVDLLLLPLLAQHAGNFWVRMLDFSLLYVLLALGLNIVVGYAGLLDLGYVAFYAVGAYMFGLLASPHLTDSFAAVKSLFPGGMHLSAWAVIPLAALGHQESLVSGVSVDACLAGAPPQVRSRQSDRSICAAVIARKFRGPNSAPIPWRRAVSDRPRVHGRQGGRQGSDVAGRPPQRQQRRESGSIASAMIEPRPRVRVGGCCPVGQAVSPHHEVPR